MSRASLLKHIEHKLHQVKSAIAVEVLVDALIDGAKL